MWSQGISKLSGSQAVRKRKGESKMERNKSGKKQKWKLQRRREKAVMAVLLSILLLFQTGTAYATTGAFSSNETAEEEGLAGTVSGNESAVNEEPESGEIPEVEPADNLEAPGENVPASEEEEDTVSGQTLPEIQAGEVTGPANPVHHCEVRDIGFAGDGSSDYSDFSYVYFGSYPQSEVTDGATIAAIEKAISTIGTTGEAGMDVWVNGIKYRRISKNDTNYDRYFDDVPNHNGYRYFKWERIKWKVLQNDGKTLFVVADKAIDCKSYNEECTDVTWETSTMRKWLNTSFYNTAFSDREQNDIVAQTVINENDPEHGTNGGKNTNDKIYLLSRGEMMNETYGFCNSHSISSVSRRIKTSDYANARGTDRSSTSKYEGNGWWWLRSPGTSSSGAVVGSAYGYLYWGTSNVSNGNYGVCPALHINLSSALWSATDDGTSGEGGGEKAATPTASLPTGSSVVKNTKLSLSCATTGASIYYTTDGTMPTVASTLYSGEITIDRDMIIKAVAVGRDSRLSDVAVFTYRIKKNGNEPDNPLHDCTRKNDGSDVTDFSYIYFGSYPQSEVTDSAIIDAIDKAIATSGIPAETGIDVWVNGIKYRRISKADTTYNGYFDKVSNNGYRYFKWERIKWKVLKNDGKTLFVLADKAIDCKKYNEKYENVTWETSTIRNWLNTSFYNAAFSSREQNGIAAQTVINGNNPEYGTSGGKNTNDKIWLLSIGEVSNPEYGFCMDYGVHSMSRRIMVSEYANARGTVANGRGNGYWWLRSPGGISNDVAIVDCDGWLHCGGDNVHTDHDGICPALRINLSSGTWLMTDDGTSGEGGEKKAEKPTASLPTGSSVVKNTKLSLSSSTAGASIYYTTDGTTPTTASAHYSGEITISRDMTVKAVAVCPGYQTSDVAEFTYKLKKSGSGGNNGNSSQKVQKLTIKAPSKKLAAGKKVKLTLKVTPENAANKAVKWKSSNQKYATVDKNGKINLKKKGIGKKVTITAMAQDESGKKASIKIKIMKHAVKTIKLKAPKRKLKAGKSMTIKASIKTTGKNANKTLKWTSSNKKYATVNSRGKVTAKKAGKGKTVTITAKSTDGSNKKAAVQIKIK